MQIIRLEMFGFKSFCDKTAVLFDKGVTGVVGPNGCGKSNIVDAIFWVMGEQSAKHLRGSSMEDVIFSGAQKRDPSQFAQVTLVVSKEGVTLPPEYDKFNEIQITRRLHRNGESEYLINNIHCRLKDIQEMFMGTGVGTKAYSIIEQGAIGKMVNAKPEDRRGIIEEAAGITKYKKRRVDCGRKIEATQQNLVRLNDIIAEKERYLGSLERQAKKAEKYKVVRDRTRALDVAVSSKRAAILKTQRQEFAAKKEEARTQESQQTSQLDTLVLHVETIRLRATDLERKVQEANDRLVQLTSREGRAERDLAVIANNMEVLTREKERLFSEIQDLRDRLEEVVLEADKLQDTSDQLKASFETKEQAAQEKANDIEQIRSELQGLEHQIQQAIQKKMDEIHARAQAETLVSEGGKQLIELHAKEEEISLVLSELDQRMTTLVSSVDETRGHAADREQTSQETQEKLNAVDQVIVERSAQLEEKQKLFAELERNYVRTKTELESLQTLHAAFEGFDEGVRFVMSEKPEGAALLSDVFSIPEEYRPAVETFLGYRLQSIVVPDLAAAVALSRKLKDNHAGRSTFVPATSRLSAQGDVIEDVPQALRHHVLGRLSAAVETTQEFQALRDSLFGSVALVDNLAGATAIWEAAPDLPLTLITREGDVLDPSGWLHAAGSRESQKDSGLLRRSQRLSELKHKLDEFGSKRALLEPLLSKLKVEIQQSQDERTNLAALVHQNQIRLTESKKDFESLEGQLRQLKLEKDRWTREHELLHQKREALDEKLTRAREQASAEAGLPEELDKITEDLRRQALQRKDVLASHEADLSNDRVALAQAKEKWTHAQERFDEKHAEQEDIQSQISWNEAQIEKIDTQWDDGIARKAQLEKDLREGSEERSVCEREVVDSRQEFSRVQEELRAREKELDEIRKTVSGSKDTLMEATLHWERAENEWQMLQSHMLERYHIELDSVDEIEAWEFLKQNYSDLMQYDDEAADAYQERIGAELAELRQKLLSMGEVSVTAIEEYDQIKQEYEFLKQQREDVIKALAQLETTMKEMDEESEKLFNQMFHAINEKFQEYFPLLFGGGTARLELTDAQNMLETGVDIVAQPPGKKLQNIGLLSGGEKALTAVSLIFSIFAVKPSPFCLLDEVDAPLDDANVGRFNTMIRRMCHTSQFILITHNKRTMEMADLLYGITMEEAGVSKLASIRLS